MSATLGNPTHVWGALAGRPAVIEITPEPGERSPNPRGREYFYFVQPEVESRGVPVAGESATIQTLMVLAHGMRRRPGDQGGYRGIVFGSIDSLKRLLDDYQDAELGGLAGHPLAAAPNRRFPPHPTTGHPRRVCCRTHRSCDIIFDRGECCRRRRGRRRERAWAERPVPGRGAAPGRTPVGYRPGQPLRIMPTPRVLRHGSRVDPDDAGQRPRVRGVVVGVGFDDPEMILVCQRTTPP